MSVKSCEKVEKSQVALTIEVGAAEFQAAIEKSISEDAQKDQCTGLPSRQGSSEADRGHVWRRGVF